MTNKELVEKIIALNDYFDGMYDGLERDDEFNLKEVMHEWKI